jgi:uncharacterized membrane-anchored protein YhcB (DUF1043 family)
MNAQTIITLLGVFIISFVVGYIVGRYQNWSHEVQVNLDYSMELSKLQDEIKDYLRALNQN